MKKSTLFLRSAAGGFTLVELLVVIVILGILASKVTMEMTSFAYDLKKTVFNLRSDFQVARYEAVSRSRNVYISFLFNTDIDGDGVPEDGYFLWVDGNGNGTYEAGTDTVLKTVAISDRIQFYDQNAAGGPTTTPSGGALGLVDGVENPNGNTFILRPNGASTNGTVYLYVPGKGNPPTIEAGPYALDLNTTGKTQVAIHRDIWYLR